MNSVAVKFTDPERVRRAVADFVRSLTTEHAEIQSIIWFGSWTNGTYSPGSDVDLCIVVNDSSIPFRERAVKYLPRLFPVGIDLFVYTKKEFERLHMTHPQWHKAIIAGEEQLIPD